MLARAPYGGAERQDTNAPDVALLFDGENRVAEIVIEHASRRVDLDEMRRLLSFEEMRPEVV